jgi:hemerythrin-like domain-containing protein
MTLRQTIQAAPGNTAELIKKLSGTSNQAVKTREGLFAQLSDELTRYVEIEEQHFLPLLRKHSETKSLAADALKGNEDLRKSLEKLTAMPKDTDEFLAELDVLNKSFQQHVRNERKELLPAVLKAFSDEEAGELADTIEDAVADAEKAKRDEKREENAQAKRQAEEAEQARSDERAESRAQKAAEQSARETSAKTADAAPQVAENVKDESQKVASDTRAAMTVYSETTQTIRDDVQAIRASSTVSTAAASEMYSAWREWFGNAMRINADAAQKLMQARTLHQVAEHQNEFAINALRNWMEGNAKVLEISQRSSKQALGPLNGRLSEVA